MVLHFTYVMAYYAVMAILFCSVSLLRIT